MKTYQYEYVELENQTNSPEETMECSRHDMFSKDCWCHPRIFLLDDGAVWIEHYVKENEND